MGKSSGRNKSGPYGFTGNKLPRRSTSKKEEDIES